MISNKVVRHLILVLIFISSWLSGQQQHLDSLENEFRNEKNPEKKVFLLYELSDEWSYFDTVQSFKKIKEARKLAKDNAYLKAFEPFYLAQIIFTSDIEKSKTLYRKSIDQLSAYKTQQALTITNRAWHNYGIMFQWENNDEKLLEILLDKAIPVSRKIHDKSYLAQNYGDVGLLYWNSKDYKRSIHYYQLALNTLKNVQNTYKTQRRFMEFYSQTAQNLIYLSEHEKSVKYLDSAFNYYHLPAVHASYKAEYHLIRAKTFEYKENFEHALNHIDSGLIEIEKNPGDFGYYHRKLLYEKAFFLNKLKRYREALNYIYEVDRDSMYQNIGNIIRMKRLMAEIEANNGNFKRAYELSEEVYKRKDSAYQKEEKVKINDLVMKYKTAEKENAILQLENENRTQKILIGSAILISLLTAGYFFSLLNQRRKRENQKLQLLEKEKEIEVGNALIAGEEQERLRLARDLHDGIGGTLTGIKLKLENFAENPVQTEINNSVNLLEQAIHNLRLTSHNLAPENLIKYGLEEAVKDYCQTMSTPGLKFEIYTSGLGEIHSQRTQLLVYRIIQELISNAVKHAEASKILLQVTRENNLLLISVEDNGKGYDPKTVKRNMGMNNIEKRIQLLNGKLQTETAPGKGTNVNIEIQL